MEARDGELEVGGSFPQPPEWLQGEALEEWRRVERISDYRECIKESDRGILTAYCVLWGDISTLAGHLKASHFAIFSSLAGKLGMTPADRSKVKVESGKRSGTPSQISRDYVAIAEQYARSVVPAWV